MSYLTSAVGYGIGHLAAIRMMSVQITYKRTRVMNGTDYLPGIT